MTMSFTIEVRPAHWASSFQVQHIESVFDCYCGGFRPDVFYDTTRLQLKIKSCGSDSFTKALYCHKLYQ